MEDTKDERRRREKKKEQIEINSESAIKGLNTQGLKDNEYLVSSLDITKTGIPNYAVDNFTLTRGKAIIINTDVSTSGGIHWITLALLPNNSDVYICDSLGDDENERMYDNIMKKKLKGYNVNWYPYPFQKLTSKHCGYFAIFTCKLIQQMMNEDENITPKEITHRIYKLFGDSPDNQDFDIIKRFFLKK